MNDVFIQVEGISKSFSKSDKSINYVLDNITFNIRKNEIVSIVGPSGCGKSTLLKILCFLEKPSEGIYSLKSLDKKDVVIIFQDYSKSLFPWLTVEKNVVFGLNNIALSHELKSKKLRDALNLVGLLDFRKEFPWVLSGGMQQRVALARAMIREPKLLLLDEPFGSLDAYTRYELEDEVLKLVQKLGITIVLVTHDVDEAVYMSDRVLVMSKSPAKIIDDIPVRLGETRDQFTTRSNLEFGTLRGRVLNKLENK